MRPSCYPLWYPFVIPFVEPFVVSFVVPCVIHFVVPLGGTLPQTLCESLRGTLSDTFCGALCDNLGTLCACVYIWSVLLWLSSDLVPEKIYLVQIRKMTCDAWFHNGCKSQYPMYGRRDSSVASDFQHIQSVQSVDSAFSICC